jgi:hypothetical protein
MIAELSSNLERLPVGSYAVTTVGTAAADDRNHSGG